MRTYHISLEKDLRVFFFCMKTWAEQFYKSTAWKETRKAYAKSKGGLCEKCYAKGLAVPGEIVHHKIHLTKENIVNPNVSLSFTNLELLCRECHAKEHGARQKRYTIDEYGRVLPK